MKTIIREIKIFETQGHYILEIEDGGQGLGRLKQQSNRRSNDHRFLVLLREKQIFGKTVESGSHRQWTVPFLHYGRS
uniref:Uncharacterized protein n=1 Tax=Cannabis sativa TaxID=3483 RepID=A0A803Q1G1_CANSA